MCNLIRTQHKLPYMSRTGTEIREAIDRIGESGGEAKICRRDLGNRETWAGREKHVDNKGLV